MKKVRTWFIWAGIVQIVTGVVNFATVGEIAAFQARGYQVDENYMIFLAIMSILFIGLGIALLITKSSIIACIVGGSGLCTAIWAISSGGSVGAGIIATILAIVGALHYESIWKQYSSQSHAKEEE